MTRVVGVEEILTRLEEVVAREGADTKRECRYVHDNAPVCLAACVYAELGVSMATLAAFETKSAMFIGSRDLDGIELTDDAVFVLDAAQLSQDSGSTWGRALERARDEAARIDRVTTS